MAFFQGGQSRTAQPGPAGQRFMMQSRAKPRGWPNVTGARRPTGGPQIHTRPMGPPGAPVVGSRPPQTTTPQLPIGWGPGTTGGEPWLLPPRQNPIGPQGPPPTTALPEGQEWHFTTIRGWHPRPMQGLPSPRGVWPGITQPAGAPGGTPPSPATQPLPGMYTATGGVGGGGGAVPTVGSSIVPQGVYSDRATQGRVNQVMALGHQAAYGVPRQVMPGFSGSSPALLSRAVGESAGNLAQAGQAAEQVRLGDRAANLQSMLTGQTARGLDVLGGAQNLAGFDAANQQFSGQMGQGMLGAIQARMGGVQGLLGQGLSDRLFWSDLQRRQQELQQQQLMQIPGMVAGMGGGSPLSNALYWS